MAAEAGVRRVLVLADSLAFHGPERAELLDHPGLYPNVLGRALGAEVDVVARLGWTARDAWWALTKDPQVYSRQLPRADVVVLGVGGMDALPASIPTYLREGIAYLRPGKLRRPVRRTFLAVHPWLARVWRGRLRILPQAATDAYLSRCVRGIRHFRPDLPIVAVTPSPHAARHYPVSRGHAAAVTAAKAWAAREGVPLLDLDPLVTPALAAGEGNPDGLHWGWPVHESVGQGLAGLILDSFFTHRDDHRS